MRLPLAACLSALACASIAADQKPWSIELEGGLLWLSRNDVRIPGTTGTQFGMRDLTGSGTFPVGRVNAIWQSDRGWGFRVMLAPLTASGTGTLGQNVQFAGQNFAAGVATQGRYKFNSYRLTYFNRWKQGPRSEWRIGGTLKIRDAEIRLTQGGVSAKDSDLGVVPLAYIWGQEKLSDRWSAIFEVDALFAPQGRAFDGSAKLAYHANDRTTWTVGYRLLEGGADNDRVYNFFWGNYLTAGVTIRF